MQIVQEWFWGLIFRGKVRNCTKSTPLYRCFQRANFDTPHGHHEFCMQFRPAETDSHAVSHFMELCLTVEADGDGSVDAHDDNLLGW